MTVQNKKCVPELRFKEFSADWGKLKIQQLIDKKFILSHLDGNHGSLYPRSEEFTKEGIPYVTANDFVNGKVDISKCKCLPLERALQFKKGIAKNGDVLFAHNATVGPVALLETDLNYVILSTTATYYRCDNNKLLNNYLRVYFNTNDFIKQYSRVMYQSTRNQVPITTQRVFHILLPTIQEQTKIANFLSSVDKKIELTEKKLENWQAYKKGIMQQIFSQKIRFKNDNGEDFPEWEVKRLGEISDVRDGTHDSPKYIENGYPLVTSKNLKENGKLCLNDISFISEIDYININKRSKASIGDILFGMIGTIGNPVLLDTEGFAIKNVALIKELKLVLNQFLIQYLNSSKISSQFYRLNAGGTQKFIALGIIRSLDVEAPSINEQIKIANFLSSIDKKIENIESQLNQLKQFKKGLLQRMFV